MRIFVPGRIEVLGKHTDYAGGRSLLAATDRGFTLAVEPTSDDRITVRDTALDQAVALTLSGDPDPAGAGVPRDWAVYPRTVVRRVARDFPGRLAGCRIEFSSDLPPAAGLSSSSALVTGIFLALDAVCGIAGTEAYRSAIAGPEGLAGYLGALERGSPFPGLGADAGAEDLPDRRAPGRVGSGGPGSGGVGTRGGSEDHVAILCAEPGALVRYAFEPVRAEGSVPCPDGYTFVVAASGVPARKTGDARGRYNRLSDQATRAAELWRTATGGAEPHLGAILALDDGFARLREVIADGAGPEERDDLLRRVRHFAAESGTLVPGAAEALAAGELARFGELAARSQQQAEELLGNQVPETAHLARSARELGAVAASAFGAGFGGSVWALTPSTEGLLFLDAWRARYLEAFPARADAATFFTTHPAAPARRLE